MLVLNQERKDRYIMRTRVKKNIVELKSASTTIKMKLPKEQMVELSKKCRRITASGGHDIECAITPRQYYADSFQYSFKAPAKINFGKRSVFSEVHITVMAGDPVIIDVYREFDKNTDPLYMDKDPSLAYGIELLDRFILIGATGTVDRFHNQLCEAIAEMELEKA